MTSAPVLEITGGQGQENFCRSDPGPFCCQGKAMKWIARVEPVTMTPAQPGLLKPAAQENWPSDPPRLRTCTSNGPCEVNEAGPV